MEAGSIKKKGFACLKENTKKKKSVVIWTLVYRLSFFYTKRSGMVSKLITFVWVDETPKMKEEEPTQLW